MFFLVLCFDKFFLVRCFGCVLFFLQLRVVTDELAKFPPTVAFHRQIVTSANSEKLFPFLEINCITVNYKI